MECDISQDNVSGTDFCFHGVSTGGDIQHLHRIGSRHYTTEEVNATLLRRFYKAHKISLERLLADSGELV